MIQMNWFTKQRHTHRLREWNYGYKGGRVRGKERLGVWDWHLFIIDIQCGPTIYTGDIAQYSVVT